MTKMKIMARVLTLALALAAIAMVAFAQDAPGQGQPGGRGRGERGFNRDGKRGGHDGIGLGRFARNLNLTDAQKEQMRQIAERHQAATSSLREQLRAQHRGERGSFDGTFNEAAVRSAAQARANVEVELQVARARMMAELYNVLTPEQKTQLAQEREQWKQKRNERRTQRGIAPTNNQ
jgi:periplasmic protein CpxP/Spy